MADTDYALESYKEANQLGRSILDSFYKLAGITFTFNAILITALGFLTKSAGEGPYSFVFPGILVALSILGIVYNCGAFFAFRSTWSAWYDLHVLVDGYESGLNMLKVQQNVAIGCLRKSPTVKFTSAFFILTGLA